MKSPTRNLFLGLMAVALALSAAVMAADTPTKPPKAAKADKPAKALTFLTKDSIDYVALLPAPPARGSEEEEGEFWMLMAEQEGRTPVEVDRAKSEIKFDVFSFSDVIGPWFTAGHCPQTAALFKAAFADSKIFSGDAKDHFGRKRPYLLDSRIKPVLELEDEGSYPSGHSTRGMMTAQLLAEIFPDKRDALLDRGRQIGWDRVIGGVHFPSDIAAGRVLGQAIAQKMLASDEFKSKLEQVKSECAEQQKSQSTAAAAPSDNL
jgi:acid phosphatase (class A)